jgi:uncharacterized membrane protein
MHFLIGDKSNILWPFDSDHSSYMLQVVSNHVDYMIYSHDSTNLRQYNTVIHCIIIMSLLFILFRKKYLNNKNKKTTHTINMNLNEQLKRTNNRLTIIISHSS